MSQQQPIDPYPSLAALRAAHNDLLTARRMAGERAGGTPALLDGVIEFIRRGERSGALLDGDDDRQAAQSLLTYWANVVYRAGRTPPDSILADFDPSLAPTLDDSLCPFLGLDTFGEDKRGYFFGRQDLVQKAIDWLKGNRLLAVVGSSGSGKSSLVRAGIVPALKSGGIPDSATWRYYPPVVPGSDPLGNLAQGIRPEPSNTAGTISLDLAAKIAFARDGFQRDPNYLASLVNTLGTTPALLVVDQFEETFTLAPDDAARQAFVAQLVGLITAPEARHTVILTMRSDFEDQVARLPEFQPLFERARLQVTPMSAGDLRSAIEKPAALVGLKFEDGIVDALLKDIVGEPAALPLLQFTLLQLWDHRDHNRITWDVYHRVGGGLNALSHAADEVYDGLIPEDQVTARRILLRMARPGEGLEVTNNRITRESLYSAGEARDRVDHVLDRLIQARLVRQTLSSAGTHAQADTQVEIAHEALIRNWPRLVEWLDEERMNLRRRLRLTAAAEQWKDKGRDPSALLRGALLAEALQYDDLNETEKGFVQASQDAAEQAERDREAARERELQQARELAAEQQRRAEAEEKRAELEQRRANEQARARKWLTVLVVALVIAGAIVTAAAVFATRQASLATSRQHVAQALSRLDSQLDLSLLLSLEAFKADDTFEARSSLIAGLQRTSSQVAALLTGHGDNTWGVAFSPDGKTLVTSDEDGTVMFWDVASRQRIGEPSKHSRVGAYSVAYSPDGKIVAVGFGDGSIILWDALTREEVKQPLQAHLGSVFSLAFNPQNPRQLASGHADGTIVLWQLAAGNQVVSQTQLIGHHNWVWSVAYSRDGKTLVSGSRDRSIILWDVADSSFVSQTLGKDEGVDSVVVSVAFSPNPADTLLVSSDSSGKLTLWNTQPWLAAQRGKPKRIRNVVHADSTVWGLAFSPDGRTLLSGAQDKLIRVWHVNAISDTYRLDLSEPPLRGHIDKLLRIAFSSDGRTFASGSWDNNVILWDLTASRTLTGHKSEVAGLSFSRDGQVLNSVGVDGKALSWNVATHNPISATVPAPDWWASTSSPYVSVNGRRLVGLSSAGVATMLDIATRKPISTPFDMLDQNAESVALSPDERLMAAGFEDGTIVVWPIAATAMSPTFTFTFTAHSASVMSLIFSPDGKRLISGSCGELTDQRCSKAEMGVWDVMTNGALRLSGDKYRVSGSDYVTVLAFGAQDTIAAGTAGGTVNVWSLRDRRQVDGSMEDKSGYSITSLAISPDGTTLAAGTYSAKDTSSRIVLWDLTTHRRLGDALIGHLDKVTSLAFSPDSRLLASGGADGFVILWDGRFESLRSRACRVANRNLTGDEWSQYMGDETPYHKTCPELP